MRPVMLWLLALSLWIRFDGRASGDGEPPPNIVFIMADDNCEDCTAVCAKSRKAP